MGTAAAKKVEPIPNAPAQAVAVERMRGLDGLRTFALLVMLVSHATVVGHKESSFPWNYVFHYFRGTLGVELFFIISAFIITRLLLVEIERTGKLDLKSFYLRRVSKLYPPLIFLLLVASGLGYWFTLPAEPASCYAAALTFSEGLFRACSWNLSHLWSLTLEEIFYLGWPFILARAGMRQVHYKWLGLAVIFCITMRLGFYFLPAGHALSPATFLLSFFDHLAMGGALAYYFRNRKGRTSSRGTQFLLVLVSLLLLWSVAFFANTPVVRAILVGVAPTICGFALALLVAVTLQEGSFLCRVFSTRWLTGVGVCSYSIYLVQQLVISPMFPLSAYGCREFPLLMMAAAILIGIGVYYLVESPLNRRLRRLLTERRSSETR